MSNISDERKLQRELYIFGEDIETDLGNVRFLTYKEYLMNVRDLSIMNMDVLHVYYQYRKMFDEKDKEAMSAVEQIKKESLYGIVSSNQMFLDSYLNIFRLVFDSDEMIAKVFDNEDSFMKYRELVLDMQVTVADEVSPNPEIQNAIERSRRVRQQNSEKQSFADIVSSIVAGTPNSFEDVCNMNVFQVYVIYHRMSAIFNYQTSTLFATVAEKVSIDNWAKHIDLFEKDSGTLKKSEFDKTYGNMLN